MTADPVDETHIPAFLAGTVAWMTTYRRAGEWDVISDGPGGVKTAAAALGAFRVAFPWAQPAAVDLGSGERWTADDGPMETLTAELARGREDVGLEAELDLRLRWQSPDGELGWSRIPAAGRLIFDHLVPASTFTVWPNLFTDEVYLYQPRGQTADRGIVAFHEAARTNRETLRQGLVAWESLSGGTLAEWESELVDGVERHGFAADARPR